MPKPKTPPPADPRAGAKRRKFDLNDQVSEPAERSGIARRTEPGDDVPAAAARPTDTEKE